MLEPIYKAKGFIENTQATIIKKLVLENNGIEYDFLNDGNTIIYGINGIEKLKLAFFRHNNLLILFLCLNI